jgi:hypothetical protein
MTDDLKLVERLKNGALEAGYHGFDGTILQEAADTITRLLKEQYEHSPERKVERNIAIWRDWISGLNHSEIGEKYGVTGVRVSQIIKKITPVINNYVNGSLNLKLFLYPGEHPHWAQDAISGMWIESTIDEDIEEVFRFYFGDSKGRILMTRRFRL